MTYIIGMITKEGLLVGSDGLTKQIDHKGKLLGVVYDAPKVHPLTDHVVVGFAGVAYDLDGFIEGYRDHLQQFGGTGKALTVKAIAENIAQAAFKRYEDTMRRHNRDLEIIVAGLDIDEDGKPIAKHVYFLAHSHGVTAHEYQHVGIGYHATTQSMLNKHHAPDKTMGELRGLAIAAIEKAGKDNAYDEVGGDSFIYEITANGINAQTIKRKPK